MFPVMQALWAGKEAGSLSAQQQFYFVSPRPLEELYDTLQDPQELVNLAGKPEHARTLERMRGAMDDWLARVRDKSAVDERDMIESMWPDGQQPVTAEPEIVLDNGELIMTSQTPGASIAYRVKHPGPKACLRRQARGNCIQSQLSFRWIIRQCRSKPKPFATVMQRVLSSVIRQTEWPSLPTPRQGDVALSRVPPPERLPLPRGSRKPLG